MQQYKGTLLPVDTDSYKSVTVINTFPKYAMYSMLVNKHQAM
jgi:hypothetical protein